MIVETLRAKGLVEVVPVDVRRADRLMTRAQKDLKTAQAMVGADPEWAYVIAAHAMLRAARALALAEGLRPRGRDHARTLLQLAGGLLAEGEGFPVDDVDQIRRKGQHFLESADRPIPLYELEATLNVAEQWVRRVAGRVSVKDPQARLL